MKTVQGWRDYARLYLDADASDMPDALIDDWLQDGVKLIRQRDVAWPTFSAIGTLTTVAGTSSYAQPVSTEGATFRDITAITGPRDELVRLSHREAQTEYFVPAEISQFQGYPEAFSVWGGLLYLYPAPDSAYTMTIRGYRNLKSWYANASSTPDLDDIFEPALRDWLVSEAYLHANDSDLASNFKSKFDEKLSVVLEDQLRPSKYGPITQGVRWGGRTSPRWPRFPHWGW